MCVCPGVWVCTNTAEYMHTLTCTPVLFYTPTHNTHPYQNPQTTYHPPKHTPKNPPKHTHTHSQTHPQTHIQKHTCLTMLSTYKAVAPSLAHISADRIVSSNRVSLSGGKTGLGAVYPAHNRPRTPVNCGCVGGGQLWVGSGGGSLDVLSHWMMQFFHVVYAKTTATTNEQQ